jgi:uncharacterized coiled-coil DUF342 family protein
MHDLLLDLKNELENMEESAQAAFDIAEKISEDCEGTWKEIEKLKERIEEIKKSFPSLVTEKLKDAFDDAEEWVEYWADQHDSQSW